MKSFIQLGLLGLAVAASSCSPSLESRAQALAPADNSTSTAVYNDVNRYRSRIGKAPIARHEGLDRLARDHSEFLRRNRGKFKLSKSGNVSHDGFESRAATARQRYGMGNIHENVAAGPRGSSMTKTWIASRGHEPAMRDNWDYTGVGVVVDSDGYIFATQLFANRATRPMLRERFGSN